jgi:hypothetical protein
VLHAGLDLSRKKLDVCLLSDDGEIVDEWASPPDADGLRGLARRAGMHAAGVGGVIESMNGARFVHDTLEEARLGVLIADAQKVKGLAPLACKTDRIDARVLAQLSLHDLVPAIWLPDPAVRREREPARFRLHLVPHRTSLKNRIHATLITFGKPCPVSDLFGHAGREVLDRLQIPDPWRRNVDARLALIEDLAPPIAQLTVELRPMGADHRYVPLLVTARVRLDQRVHRRLRDRRHRALRLAGQAVRLCRPVPQRHPVGRHRSPRSDLKARPQVPALGAGWAASADPRSPRSTSPQADRGDLAHAHPQPTVRSGRCHFSSIRLTALNGIAPPDEPSHYAQSPRRWGDRGMSAARHYQRTRGP